MELKNCFYHIWIFQLFLMLSEQNQIRSYLVPLNSIHNTVADKVTVDIIRNCYCEKENTVLSGNWQNNDIFARNREFTTFPPLYKIGIHDDLHFKRHKRLKNVFKLDLRVVQKKKYPSRSFILMVSSHDELTLALKMLKESILWNHEGFFLIVYSSNENQCSEVKSLLHFAWKFRLLHVTLLCYDEGSSLRLFTFNPFTQYAPKFWSFVESHEEKKSAWTLYQHDLTASSSAILYPTICKYLKFDKTRNLGGYAVQVGGYLHPRFLVYDKTKKGMHRYGGVNGDISLTVWTFLNATPKVKLYARPGFVDDNGSLQSVLQDLLSGKIEFCMNMNRLRDFWRLQSYPHEIDGFCLVSLKEHTSATENLWQVLRPRNWTLPVAVALALVVTLKFLTGRGLSTSALELVRLLSTAPTYSRPRHSSSRSLLALFGLVATLLVGCFHGELRALDIAPQVGDAIETEADLAESRLPVYGSVDFGEILRDVSLRRRYQYGTYTECMERLMQGHRVVCVSWCNQAGFNTCLDEKLHLSRGLRGSYLAFSISEDWPIYSRFNQILMRLSEGGLIQYYRSKKNDAFLSDKNNSDVTAERHRLILRKNVNANLQLWSFGIVMAMIILFLEISYYLVRDHLLMLWEKIYRVLNIKTLSGNF